MKNKNTHPLYAGKNLNEILHQVPVDYYQNGIEKNLFQKLWHKTKLKYVFSMIKLGNPAKAGPKKILDVGCASGWFLSEVAKFFPFSAPTGIDLYKEAVKYGNKKYKNLKLINCDAHALPFKNNSFDAVICCEVLEHVGNPERVLKEIKRVLSSNGIVVIEIDSGNFLFKIAWYWWTNIKKGVWMDAHVNTFGISKLEDLFEKNGFRIVKKRTFNFTMGIVFLLKKNKSS